MVIAAADWCLSGCPSGGAFTAVILVAAVVIVGGGWLLASRMARHPPAGRRPFCVTCDGWVDDLASHDVLHRIEWRTEEW